MESKENVKNVSEDVLKEGDIKDGINCVVQLGKDELDAKPSEKAKEVLLEDEGNEIPLENKKGSLQEDEGDAKSFIREMFQAHHNHQEHTDKHEQEEAKPALKESDEEKLIRLVRINGHDTYSSEGKSSIRQQSHNKFLCYKIKLDYCIKRQLW